MKIYIRKKSDIFYICFSLWLINDILLNSNLKHCFPAAADLIHNCITCFVLALLLYRCIFLQRYERGEIAVILPVSIIIFISAVLSGENFLLLGWLFILASRNVPIRNIIKVAVTVEFVSVLLVIVLYKLGMIEEYLLIRGDLKRHSLGFSHPNQLGLRIFQLVTGIYFLIERERKIKKYAIFLGAILFVYYVPNSQSTLVCLCLFMILAGIFDITKQKGFFIKQYSKIAPLSAGFLNGISIILCYIDVRQFRLLFLLDNILSSRFLNGHKVWKIYGLTWFGQRVNILSEQYQRVSGSSRLWLDNAYVSLILRYGIVVYITFSVLYILLMRDLFRQNQIILATVLFVFSVYGLMEKGIYQMTFNNFLLLFGAYLYKTKYVSEDG